MIWAGAGAIWLAILILTICLMKIVDIGDKNMGLCRWCGKLPVYSQELCEPCLDQARKIGLE
jgi:hypothetical protein